MKNSDWKKCVICGDSKLVIQRIPDQSIDFILTDPPYNIGKHSTGNIPLPGRSPMNNDLAEWDWKDFNPEEWVEEFIRILKPSGNLFIFTTYNQLGRWYDCLDHRFDTTNFMVWHKTNPAPKIFKAGFLNSCEMIYTCWNKGHTWNFISQKEMHNFIESPICMRPERLSNPKHPAQKPLSILRKMIDIASNPNDIIFDPFMGVGSVGVAALEKGRKFIGVEVLQEYFDAAKLRIEGVIKAIEKDNILDTDMVKETQVRETNDPLWKFVASNSSEKIKAKDKKLCQRPVYKLAKDGVLSPLLKWAGGKEKELKYILPNLPIDIDNYYEPFVGGGAVYAAFSANHYYINDLSEELMTLYRLIAEKNKLFYKYAYSIDDCWKSVETFFTTSSELLTLYLDFRSSVLTVDELKVRLTDFCILNKQKIVAILGNLWNIYPECFLKEVEKNLVRKMLRMNILEKEKHILPQKDLENNIETALKSALYMYYRSLYNASDFMSECIERATALFLFIRNYSYSGMFRYNDKGEFNVPYGGIAYNRNSLTKKLAYYQSEALLQHLAETTIYNCDFEVFLTSNNLHPHDFIFLDPPYDSEFSTYAQNEFTKADQQRLASYLIYRCKARWMMIIKNTDFIYQLYAEHKHIKIRTFEKEYLVSFMNRNDKKVTHLLITNY